MRLVDANALKEKLKNRYEIEQDEIDKGWNLGIGVAINLIDNAPTVAVNCKDCDGYEAGYSAGLKDAERPQGEWVVSGLDYKCSNCGMIPCFKQYNFCPSCGAKMKGDAE